MKATFIISFDCEGKWGFADHLTAFHQSHLTNRNLNQAYKRIIDLLNKYTIKGTFAFVGSFTLSIDEYYANQEWFADNCEEVQRWLRYFKKYAQNENFEGWFNPEPLKIVAQEKIHEIGAHGFTHAPLGESYITKAGFLEEMNSLKKISHFKDKEKMTFIYPRNAIGYINELLKFGFIGYRGHIYEYDNLTSITKKIKRLAVELNVLDKAQSHARPSHLIRIPSGYLLNYRHGFMGNIPLGWTIKRWENIIIDAVKNNKVVHLWSHPHNFITGKDMFLLLDRVLEIVNKFVKKGLLNNLTQKEYAESLLISRDKL
jgi:hypothetical protein